MRNQLQLSQATETLNRGKSYIEVFKEILDLKEMCQSLDNSVLLEYVPVKLVACFEQFLGMSIWRYCSILRQDRD